VTIKLLLLQWRCWWQDAGSCNTYNSISGHTLLLGSYTKLVLAFKFFQKYAKHAAIYTKNMVSILCQFSATTLMQQNWSDSSKAIEPNGTVDCVKQLWKSMVESFCE